MAVEPAVAVANPGCWALAKWEAAEHWSHQSPRSKWEAAGAAVVDAPVAVFGAGWPQFPSRKKRIVLYAGAFGDPTWRPIAG